jgi:hypothetical protein
VSELDERDLDDLQLDAWSVEPLDSDLEDRVIAALEQPAPREDTTPTRRHLWPALAFSLAAGVLLSLFVSMPDGARGVEDSPAVIALGERARIIPTEGAQISWSEDGRGRFRVDHRAGEARYEVQRGSSLEVTTPAGGITVTGTIFTVEVMTMNDAKRTNKLLAGAAVAGAFVAGVAVLEGQVEVHNDYGRVEVAADRSAWMTDAEPPRDGSSMDASEQRDAPAAVAQREEYERTIRARQRNEMRDRIRHALEARPEAQPEPREGDRSADYRTEIVGNLDKEYIREVIIDDLIPLAHECYSEALSRFPRLGGRLVLKFTIMGDASVGGIVEGVEVGDGTEITDPQMLECMSESMASVMFDPPDGGGAVLVTYPFVFAPPDDDEADSENGSAETSE